ncbi:MAG TPA: EAL domain-containing protein [Candidatus Baltobacteraceae bacterium]|nr:EAL domain-containing protein [Candidatus Baltobacteraceae bacterium]
MSTDDLNPALLSVSISPEPAKDREIRLALALSRLPLYVFTLDRDLVLRFVEGGGLAPVLEAQQNIGKTIAQIKDELQARSDTLRFYHAALHGEPCRFEEHIAGRVLEIHLQPVVGETYSILGMAVDVTDRVEVFERLNAVMESMPITLFTCDGSLRITSLQRGAMYSSFRVPADDLVGKSIAEVEVNARGTADGIEYYERALRGETVHFEVPWYDRFLEVHLRPVPGPGDDRIVGAAYDITSRVVTERALRENEARLDQAQEIAHLGSWRYDFASGRIAWSRELFRLYGLAPTEDLTVPERVLFDYVHPDDQDALSEAMNRAREMKLGFAIDHRIVLTDGSVRWVQRTASPLVAEDGTVTGLVGTQLDITERKRAEEELTFLAHHDPLTNLPNRALFTDRLSQALAQSRRNGTCVAVLFLDVDRFKNVNDTLGHAAGDRVLREIGSRLKARLRDGDTVARMGGDEFAVVVTAVEHAEKAADVAQTVRDAVTPPIVIDGRELHFTVSIGISVAPQDTAGVAELIANADTAMYQAKSRGRDNFQFFTPAMHVAAVDRLAIEHDLRLALDRGELTVFYQPIVDLNDGEIILFEALVRWNHPEHGLLEPDRFITIAEETGLVIAIGDYVLETVCRQSQAWGAAGLRRLPIAVNVSPRHLEQGNLPARLRTVLQQTGLPPSLLEIEVTESGVMHDVHKAMGTLEELADAGITVSIDDFGTGYSSLGYLKRLPIAGVKIDRVFIADIITDPQDAAIAAAVVALAQKMSLYCVAEGVETQAQADFLRAIGCRYAQGYLFGKPAPANEVEAALR